MRRLRMATILGVAALALGLAVTGLAASGGNGGKTIELTGCAGSLASEQIDLGATGPSPGDMLVGRTDLCQGSKVGFARFTCVFNIGSGVMCTNHNTLSGRGQIVSQQSGDPTEGPLVVEAVTGGTGEFRNARGQVRVDFSNPGGPRITIRLLG